MTAPGPGRVVTPEAVALELQPAGLATRFLGRLLDLAIQGLALFVLFLTLAAVASATDAVPGWVAGTSFFLFVFGVLFGYPIACETLWRGRTVGKLALGLRVVTTDGAPVRFRHAAIRAAFDLIDLYSCQGVVGVVAILVSNRNQRLGDMVAGTLVLRDRTAATVPRPFTFLPPPGLEGYATTLDVSGLSATDYGVVRSFLVRAPSLSPDARHRVASEVAAPVLARIRHTPPPWVGPEVFLLCVAAEWQRRHGGPVAGAPSYARGW